VRVAPAKASAMSVRLSVFMDVCVVVLVDAQRRIAVLFCQQETSNV